MPLAYIRLSKAVSRFTHFIFLDDSILEHALEPRLGIRDDDAVPQENDAMEKSKVMLSDYKLPWQAKFAFLLSDFSAERRLSESGTSRYFGEM